MKFKIPNRYELGGQSIIVKMVDKCKAKGVKAHGSWNYRKNIIEVERPIKISKEFSDQIFFHEMTHCILDHIAEDALSNNEDFVNRFSAALFQIIKTME